MSVNNKLFLLVLFAISSIVVAHGQNARLDLRRANKLYKEGKYSEAEQIYHKGTVGKELQRTASFGLGNALYKQKKYDEAGKQFELIAADSTLSPQQRASAYHNLGNIAMQSKKYEEAVNAYKQSLINNPTDDATRYNLVLAQKQLKKDQQNQNNQDKNQDQQNQDKNKEQQQNKDNQNKDQKDRQDPNKDEKDEGQQNKDQKGEGNQPPPQGKMSREQAEQLLDSYKQNDEQTRKRVEQQMRAAQEKRNEKNKRPW